MALPHMNVNFWGLIVLVVMGNNLTFAQSDQRPNILVIYADDLGFGDVGCYNPSRGRISTPHLDRLATEGVRFTDAHSSSAVCSPSRYTLLTGRYHWRTRLQRGIVGLWGSPLIAADRLTLAGLAKQQGYRTACIGKWHLGWDWRIPQQQRGFFRNQQKVVQATAEHRAAWRGVFSQPIAGGPCTRGFDAYFGTDVPNWPPYCFIENNRTVGIPSEFAAPELLRKNQASLQGPALAGWSLEPILPTLGDRVCQFIRDSANDEEPFFVYWPLTSPHTPLSVNEEWRGRSGLGLYADFVMETDAVIGRVLAALHEQGLDDNTLVVFTSDNGCAPYIGVQELEAAGHYPSGPLRGYKSDVWEGGHRVPFIVRWPGHVEPSRVCRQLIHQADLMATMADLFAVELPDHVGEDSFSFLPLLRGSDVTVRETSISCSIRGVPSLREHQWKLIPGPGSGGWDTSGDDQPIQLYNLANDLGEQENLAAQAPERVAAMQKRLAQIIARGRSTPGPSQANDVRVETYPKELRNNAPQVSN